jgi:hypothetical protein
MNTEIWKVIENSNGNYKISNLGNVFSIKYQKIVRPKANKEKTLRITLPTNCALKRKTFSIARLVAEHFIPNLENKTHVLNINGDKSNNRFDNVKWVSRAEILRQVGKKGNKLSIYKGVSCRIKRDGIKKWIARICIDKKLINLGSFHTEEDAALAYNIAAIKNFGKDYVVNNIQDKRVAFKLEEVEIGEFSSTKDDNPNEIWKDVVGYEEFYEVSNLGNVYSKYYKRILCKYLCEKKSYLVTLKRNGGVIQKRISKIVAEAFIENPEDKEHVNHINGDRTDDRLENLRWATHTQVSQNMKKQRGPCTSSFKGVSFRNNALNPWEAKITVNGVPILLGNFYQESEAARAYDRAALKHFGEFSKNNEQQNIF